MKNNRVVSACAIAVAGVLAFATPTASQAADDWDASVTIYAWLPTMGGDVSFPLGGSVSAELDPSDILDALNFTFMGIAEVRKGRWGALTDVIYLDLGGEKKHFRDLTIGGLGLPAQLETRAEVTMSGWVWTLGGTYLIVDDESRPLSLIAGTRLLDLTNELDLTLSGDITGIPLPGRKVKGESELTNWDAIVGLKGRFGLGDGQWYVPYYVDVGTGESDFTWQAILGLGYAFDWGDLTVAWRYLDYDFGSDEAVEEIWQSGAAIGVTFHF